MNQANTTNNSNVMQSSLDADVSLLDVLSAAKKLWIWILLLCVCCMSCALLYFMFVSPKYRSMAVVQAAESIESSVSDLLNVMGSRGSKSITTEMEILRSQTIISEAIKDLNLTVFGRTGGLAWQDMGKKLDNERNRHNKYLRSIFKISISDDYAATIKGFYNPSQGKISFEKSRIFKEDTTIVLQPGENELVPGIVLTYTPPEEAPDKTMEVFFAPVPSIVRGILANLTIIRVGKDDYLSNLVKVQYVNKDRIEAAEVVNSMVKNYLDYSLRWKRMQSDQSGNFIEEQLAKQQKILEAEEQELRTYLENNEAAMLSAQSMELIELVTSLEIDIQKLNLEKDMLASMKNQINRANDNNTPIVGGSLALLNNNQLALALEQYARAQYKYKTLLTSSTPLNPSVKQLSEELDGLKTHIKLTTAESIVQNKKQIQTLEKQLNTLKERINAMPQKEIEYGTIKRKVEVSEKIVTLLLTKLEESKILSASTIGNQRVIDWATVPNKRHSPSLPMVIIVGLFLSCFGTILFLTGYMVMYPTIEGERIKKILPIPLVGQIPKMSKQAKLHEFMADPDKYQTANAPFIEALRNMIINISFLNINASKHSIVILSSFLPSEGKSTNSAWMSLVLSLSGKKVLLIDADLRKPSQSKQLNISRTPGLSDYVCGNQGLKKYHFADNFDFIAAGTQVPNSHNILASKAYADLLESERANYDYIIIDAPPLLFSDAVIVSSLVDHIFIVANPEVLTRTALRNSYEVYNNLQCPKSLILNGMKSKLHNNYYYHYSHRHSPFHRHHHSHS